MRAQVKALTTTVSATQPRVAEKVAAISDRLRALQQRMLRNLANKWCALCAVGLSYAAYGVVWCCVAMHVRMM